MTRPHYLSQAVEPFLRQMAADGRAVSSISSYRRQLQLLIEGLGDDLLDQVKPHQPKDYLTSPSVVSKAHGVSKHTIIQNRMNPNVSVWPQSPRVCRAGTGRRRPQRKAKFNLTVETAEHAEKIRGHYLCDLGDLRGERSGLSRAERGRRRAARPVPKFARRAR